MNQSLQVKQLSISSRVPSQRDLHQNFTLRDTYSRRDRRTVEVAYQVHEEVVDCVCFVTLANRGQHGPSANEAQAEPRVQRVDWRHEEDTNDMTLQRGSGVVLEM
jgi:hypothetical protein